MDADLIRYTVYDGKEMEDTRSRRILAGQIEGAVSMCTPERHGCVLLHDTEIREAWMREPLFKAIALRGPPMRVDSWERRFVESSSGARWRVCGDLRTVFSWTSIDQDTSFYIYASVPHHDEMVASWCLRCFSGGDKESGCDTVSDTVSDTEEESDFDDDFDDV